MQSSRARKKRKDSNSNGTLCKNVIAPKNSQHDSWEIKYLAKAGSNELTGRIPLPLIIVAFDCSCSSIFCWFSCLIDSDGGRRFRSCGFIPSLSGLALISPSIRCTSDPFVTTAVAIYNFRKFNNKHFGWLCELWLSKWNNNHIKKMSFWF